MKNLRLNQEGNALVVTGLPEQRGTVPAGHRLVCADGSHLITLYDGRLWCDGSEVAALSGELRGIHRVGPLLVVSTSAGMVYLADSGIGYDVVSLDDALPSLSVAAQGATAVTSSLPAIAFAEPYDRWQAPLSQADVTAVTAALRTAWNSVTGRAQAYGLHYARLRVRYGVRLWDDSYLWMSEPVTLGGNLPGNAPRVTVDVDVDSGGRYVGVPAATLSLTTFTLGVSVNSGVGEQWRSMIKAVDVLVTDQAQLVQDTATLDYRCLTTSGGTRRAVLDYGFVARAAAQVDAQLVRSPWRVVASCTDLDALAQGRWVESAVVPDITMSAAQGEQMALPAQRRVVASLLCNGRLYVADDTGLMTTSRAGNPLVVERECVVTGARLLGMAQVPRSLYSGGFGRYPVYLFTDEGIFALPLTAQGAYGEPRLLDRTVLAAGCQPVEGNRDIYFTSWRGHLCCLQASTVTVIKAGAEVRQMVWDDVHGELWCRAVDGAVSALLADGTMCCRTLQAVHFYGDLTHALAVTATGDVLDLTAERQAMMDVEWLSEPVECPKPLRRIMWQVYGDDVSLRLDVLGERGVSCHGFLVNRLEVTGRVAAPIVVPLFAPPLRTMRRRITGRAATGAFLIMNYEL